MTKDEIIRAIYKKAQKYNTLSQNQGDARIGLIYMAMSEDLLNLVTLAELSEENCGNWGKDK